MQTLKLDRILKISVGLLALTLAACAGMDRSLLVPPDPKLDGVSCIVVLPFENLSNRAEAGKVISDILATELYASQRFNVMEWEEAQNYWQQLPISYRVELCRDAEVSIFAARHDYIPQQDSGYIYEHCIN